MPRSACALLCSLLLAFSAHASRVRAVHHPAPPFLPVAEYTEGGYADAISVVQGGVLTLRIATSVTPFDAEVVDLASDQIVSTIRGLTSHPQDCTGRSTSGCGWEATHVLDVPFTWPSGAYAVRFPTRFGRRSLFFVVRAANPGATSRTLLVVATHTYEAYNTFGGKNVYPSTSPQRASAVSFDRPFHDYDGLGRFPVWDRPFMRWMRAEGRTFEVATDTDLHDPALLLGYRFVIFVGHSEYWTRRARESIEAFSARGGHIAIFGGNTMWWQARLERGDRTLVVYKDAAADPERDPRLVTVNWFAEPVLDPENTIVGASFRNAGFTNIDGAMPRNAYTVTSPSHWAFAGTGVARGQLFGAQAAGGETDGVLFNCGGDGFPEAVDGSDATPLNYEILATVPASAGSGTIGLYTNRAGGVVFNAGTQDWALALATDPVVVAITRNVLDRLSNGAPQLIREVSSPFRTRERFNCAKVRESLLPGWRGEEENARITNRCAREGPSGLELGGGPRVLIARNFAPRAGDELSGVDVQFELDVSNVTQLSDDVVGLVTLHSRAHDVNTRRARVELQATTQAKSVRLAVYDREGVSSTKGDWIKLTSGWHTIRLRWESPGQAMLTVDGSQGPALLNPAGGMTANELSIFYPQSDAGDGYACIDDIAAREFHP